MLRNQLALSRSFLRVLTPIIRRMIELIRKHFKGDFNWESHRLNRVIVLSARIDDNDGLEDFLMLEFFGAGSGFQGSRPFR